MDAAIAINRSRGGRDGGRGRGGQGGSLPCRERNPVLASNSRISTLATSISPLQFEDFHPRDVYFPPPSHSGSVGGETTIN